MQYINLKTGVVIDVPYLEGENWAEVIPRPRHSVKKAEKKAVKDNVRNAE